MCVCVLDFDIVYYIIYMYIIYIYTLHIYMYIYIYIILIRFLSHGNTFDAHIHTPGSRLSLLPQDYTSKSKKRLKFSIQPSPHRPINPNLVVCSQLPGFSTLALWSVSNNCLPTLLPIHLGPTRVVVPHKTVGAMTWTTFVFCTILHHIGHRKKVSAIHAPEHCSGSWTVHGRLMLFFIPEKATKP